MQQKKLMLVKNCNRV